MRLPKPGVATVALPAARPKRPRGSAGNRRGLQLAPAVLLVVAAAAAMVAPVKPDLTGRRIVAYDDGSLDWTVVDPGNVAPGLSQRYGLLPALVASLGGQFVVSKDLRAGDLREADVLVVLPPGASKPDEAKGTVPFFADTKIGTVPHVQTGR